MDAPPSDRFRLHVLGTPDLRAPDGRRVSSVLSQPKRLGLLTYLALAPTPVSRVELVATFWPDVDETRARNALSQALFHLRRALGEAVVESHEGDRLWVSPDRVWCDARDEGGGGSFLDGWHPEEPPLQAWLARERAARVAVEPVALPAPVTVPPRRRAASLRWAAAVGALALMGLVVVVGRLGGRPSPEELAVLRPRVIAAPGAMELPAQVILDEILAHLPERDGVRIVPAPSASSAPDLRLQLAAIGTPDETAPHWILEVSVRVTDTQAAVVGLLYRSPELDVPGRESFSVDLDRADAALVEVPREIARQLASMVARTLDEG